MKKTLRYILDCIFATLSIATLLAYAVMPFDVELLPVPLWLSLFAMLPVLPTLAIAWLVLTAKAYIGRRHVICQAAI